ncbi:MAG TPA: acyl-CoA dehydrogenase family protein, partial [Acidimicrobiales bacterium]
MTVTDETITQLDVDELVDGLLSELPPKSTDTVTFLREQFDRGLAFVHFPVGCGGLGGSPADQIRAQRRLIAAGAPMAMMRNVIGYGMVAPTIVAHGTPRQKERYLRPLFTGEEVWCQLFSEPGAGSDVAGLSMRAVRDGDEWIVNGQKVWTTLAHLSRFGLLLARTDPDVPKHPGLTMFLVDMTGPGVDVRPIHQITGEAEFNECFFTDARINDEDRLGDVGEGWAVAITTLMNERVSIGGNSAPRGSGAIAEAVRLYKERYAGDTDAHAAVLRDEVLQAWVRTEVLRLT